MKPYVLNEFQENWLTDLETTKAKQGEGWLNDGRGGYCCLGRAYVSNGYRGTSDSESTGTPLCYNDKSHDVLLAKSVLGDTMLEQLKLRGAIGIIGSNNPKYESPVGVKGNMIDALALTDLNDCAGWSFKEIAAFIRKHPRSVFRD